MLWILKHNKQYHWKVLLISFHLNGHTTGFRPQTLFITQLYAQGSFVLITRYRQPLYPSS